MKKLNLTMFCVLAVVLIACNEESNSNLTTDTPEDNKEQPESLDLADVTHSTFASIDLEPIKFSVSAEKGGKIELEGGTTIDIPENSFVDQEGKPVTGEVDIKVKEFNSLSDIILGGVNMKYDSAGVTYDFVSAGMFHIDGEQNGKEIEIAAGKEIEYTHASDVADLEDTPCFNFYQMKEGETWSYIDTEKAQDNPKYEEGPKYVKPEEASSEDLVFEIEMKGAKSFLNEKSVLWKYTGRRPDTVDKKMLNEITAENVEIIKTNETQLSHKIEATIDGVIHDIPVEPVLMGEDLEQALANFQSKMDFIEKSDEVLKNYLQKQYTRRYSIPSFGMYNWDIRYKRPRQPLIVEAEDIHGLPQDLCTFWLISKTENLTVNFTGNSMRQFSYNPNADNHIIAITPNDEVAIVKSTSFFKQVKPGMKSVKLRFQELDGRIESEKDFLAIVEKL